MSLLSAPEIRARVAGAARTVTPTWPLTSFIAVNPVAGYESRPMSELATALGEMPTRPERDYLRSYEGGEISATALQAALRQLLPELAGMGKLTAAGRSVSAVAVAMAGLQQPPSDTTASGGGSGDDAGTPVDQYLAGALGRFYADPIWAPPASGTLYSRFRELTAHDRTLPGRVRRVLAALPDSPEDAISRILHQRTGDPGGMEAVLTAQLRALPGWTSHLAWRATHVGDATLTDLVACRLSLAYALGIELAETGAARPAGAGIDPEWVARIARTCFGHRGSDAGEAAAVTRRVLMLLDATTRLMVWQTAVEVTYRDRLFAALDQPTWAAPTAEAQLAFCIDTRSEGIRRRLERRADVQTFGFAGFFGVPLRHTALFAQEAREQYPALLSSGHATGERAIDPDDAHRAETRAALAGAARSTVKQVAATPASAFSWAELSGWGGLLASLGRTVARSGSIDRYESVDSVVDVCERMSLDEQAAAAEAILRMMGLTRFAPLVVLTGHRTGTVNNLYRAALDCGACGGNPGGANARAAAAIFNNPDVRHRLGDRGLSIPATTWFAAAEHETTTDTLTILDRQLIPDSHCDAVARLEAAAAEAADELTRERAADLPGARETTPLARTRRRATDWSEMYPELGLANNAALLIAPRSVSRGIDLERRVFLHDYDPAADPDGQALENIMTAPLIVAQWINAQYYFSTIHPERYGAGSKTVHNPVGDLGVLAGHTGDLRTGLPWQSVAAGERLLHTPLRLSVLIQAPLDRIGRIISVTDALRALLDGEWISLHAREDADHPWRRYGRYGFTTDERTL
ncbi:putative inorganic carbon transporter subunit DabA [Leifsonia sp. fls2-241-R2A-40a]|uniref:putative inorganic carbon transporter subunit DabA n=1 Tax=Leifsonia sp. fls2-241-R2A-40a TaxID=3040290 RepID=UPI00254F6900|nr:putative inorganic carbon transporter subunit DabA [Leifsonia sp. fls2-241-R2A-40a]